MHDGNTHQNSRCFPVSMADKSNISSVWALTVAAIVRRTRLRSSHDVVAHCFCAAFARRTAAATASGDVTGTSPRNSRVAGL